MPTVCTHSTVSITRELGKGKRTYMLTLERVTALGPPVARSVAKKQY